MSATHTAKCVLITGGTEGLGRSAALLLAGRGYRVFSTSRSAEKRAQLETLARERKLPLETLEMDVCDDASVKRAVAGVLERAGAVDVLINNAGVGYTATVEELQLEDLRRQFETNFFGVVRVTQAVLPAMRERRAGRILNVSSIAGKIAPPLYGSYSGSKFALEGLTDALRLEVYPFGIDVVLIEPGYIVTSFQRTAADLSSPYVPAAKMGPYAKVYANAWRATNAARQKSRCTPDDFARVVLRAIETPRPKPRYTVTRHAAAIAWAKRLLSDRAMDWLTRRQFGVERG